MKSIQTLACICLFCAFAFGQTESDLLVKYEKDLKANPRSSITHFRIGGIYLQRGVYQSAANAFQSLNGDLEPKWVASLVACKSRKNF